jgi:hypothetical protein
MRSVHGEGQDGAEESKGADLFDFVQPPQQRRLTPLFPLLEQARVRAVECMLRVRTSTASPRHESPLPATVESTSDGRIPTPDTEGKSRRNGVGKVPGVPGPREDRQVRAGFA